METLDQLLEDMRMSEQKDMKVKHLSGGFKRKLSILQALVYGSEVGGV